MELILFLRQELPMIEQHLVVAVVDKETVVVLIVD
jgi:hypothetical protein|tara:strand:+ start:311 stop:415 length:105 start_codon:yes stop_codon:yes gene_type:complete